METKDLEKKTSIIQSLVQNSVPNRIFHERKLRMKINPFTILANTFCSRRWSKYLKINFLEWIKYQYSLKMALFLKAEFIKYCLAKFSDRDYRIRKNFQKSLKCEHPYSRADKNELKYFKKLESLKIIATYSQASFKIKGIAKNIVLGLKHLSIYFCNSSIIYSKHNSLLSMSIQPKDFEKIKSSDIWKLYLSGIKTIDFKETKEPDKDLSIRFSAIYCVLKFQKQIKLLKLSLMQHIEKNSFLYLLSKYASVLQISSTSVNPVMIFDWILQSSYPFPFFAIIDNYSFKILSRIDSETLESEFSKNMLSSIKMARFMFGTEKSKTELIFHIWVNSFFVGNLINRYFDSHDCKYYFSNGAKINKQEIKTLKNDERATNLTGIDRIFYSYDAHRSILTPFQVLLYLSDILRDFVQDLEILSLEKIILENLDQAEFFNTIIQSKNIQTMNLDLKLQTDLFNHEKFFKDLCVILTRTSKVSVILNQLVSIEFSRNEMNYYSVEFNCNNSLDNQESESMNLFLNILMECVSPIENFKFIFYQINMIVFEHLCTLLPCFKNLKNFYFRIQNASNMKGRCLIQLNKTIENCSTLESFSLDLLNGMYTDISPSIIDLDTRVNQIPSLKIGIIQLKEFLYIDQKVKNLPYVYL